MHYDILFTRRNSNQMNLSFFSPIIITSIPFQFKFLINYYQYR